MTFCEKSRAVKLVLSAKSLVLSRLKTRMSVFPNVRSLPGLFVCHSGDSTRLFCFGDAIFGNKTHDFFASVKQYETFRPITRVSRLASLNSGGTVRDFLKKLRTVQLEREKSRTVFRVCVLGQFGPVGRPAPLRTNST